ncbi:ComF family protein [Saccharophagus sp. K07]|jgi:ComF family protein|uniref:ComF family protein n=1 Tax=Saccharophagus sp. K07 TaxID=2283636 RepID=UPI0016520113|nr:ComF family protein [Saccharophagus sp. K07]MBC6904280.1 ComF family protein [Saccharophagus sp. K07]
MDLMHLLYRHLPHRCSLCGHRAHELLCRACHADLPRNTNHCQTCALPLKVNQPTCGDCLAYPKLYELTVSPLLYQHPVDHLILHLKKRNPRIQARALLPLLVATLQDLYQASWPDIMVPVPSPWLTRLRRGFNHAEALAELLSAATGVKVLACMSHTGKVKPQKTLDRKERFANLRNTFQCRAQFNGETIAVVDDVITTGATAQLMSRCLLDAGAGKVHIWSLARTPKPGT